MQTALRTCDWCKCEFESKNDNRTCCRKPVCRKKEIDHNVNQLMSVMDILKNDSTGGKVEIRCPGNDAFGPQVKITLFQKKEGKSLIEYLKYVLFNRVKGNLIIDVDGGDVVTEMFVPIESPNIIFSDEV